MERRKGGGASEAQWGVGFSSAFFHHYSQPIVDYFQQKEQKEDVMAHLAKHPVEDVSVVLAALSQNPGVVWEEPPMEWQWDEREERELREPLETPPLRTAGMDIPTNNTQ